jgi:molybdate transport system substrate-binding protein
VRHMLRYVIVLILVMTGSAQAADIQLYAAGSLHAALTDVANAFTAATGHGVQEKFGPSGALKDEINAGARADVFASANMEYPQALNLAHKSGPVTLFARNKLCALARPGLTVDSANLVDRMLDPAIKLGTSTPNSDPSGDYAFEVFRKVETIRPGAGKTLEGKALMLTGSTKSATPPAGRSPYGWHIAEGRADIFLVYCTAAAEARIQYTDLEIVTLPGNLAVGANYGLTVITGAQPTADEFARFVMAPAGQKILVGYGFAPGQSER